MLCALRINISMAWNAICVSSRAGYVSNNERGVFRVRACRVIDRVKKYGALICAASEIRLMGDARTELEISFRSAGKHFCLKLCTNCKAMGLGKEGKEKKLVSNGQNSITI
jgi:hypothetical protein